ncbi:hypothetical protein DPMN_036701 [Dreissena polymorpha]|uniref:Uncharacterized protein n=1 Tax=Dreissena polymorpha TaxID=45954 RepID=A0A9D4RLP7_DREPO|nr:hypothetical protein DPMN_036701 [Dreissena polymorpha]
MKTVTSTVYTNKLLTDTRTHTPTYGRRTSHGLTKTIFELNSCIKETNVLTKFHENWAKNVTSRKNAPPTGGHVLSPILAIVKLVQDINKTKVLTNFHDDWAKIVILEENCHYTYKEKCPTHWRPYINKTNVLTNFHDDWTKIVTSRVFTRFLFSQRGKTATIYI